ncbi:unnamed protein product [Adineta ricciae]|uniref:Uncharacterized protein n=1 Tax=Adineta ricciae TaxID=249248 RepID=A0A815WAH7_ADIRI|nr:unnamed protein product [Adineta ricciae]CAF1541342.1 unnamed protein product [Adineta ricciae]
MKAIFIQVCIIQLYFLVVTSIQLSPCAKWNSTGRTTAGTGTAGSTSTQLDWPHGIFIHQQTNSLYVADSENNRVQVFQLNDQSMLATTVAFNVSDPTSVYVDDDEKDGPILYVAMEGSNRVEKWTKGATVGIQVGRECRDCSGVWLDKQKNIYVAEAVRFRVVKWLSTTQAEIIVAGKTDQFGNKDELLNVLGSIYVHSTDGTVYVADRLNNRVQKWTQGASYGTTVAGNGIANDTAQSLDNPVGIFVDERTGVVFVVDTFNERIQRWLPDALQGETIVGDSDSTSPFNQLKGPTSMAFDSDGNLYVSDSLNHRIQKYALLDNSPCSSSSAAIFSVLKSKIIFLLPLWFYSRYE